MRVVVLLAVALWPTTRGVIAQTSSTSEQPLPDFGSPPPTYRPKFRYWLPDASVSAAVVEADFAALAAAGAGGIELVPFYNYGKPPMMTDWSVYGFGTPAFAALLKAALRSAAQHGLRVDLSLGANQGAGVPTPADDDDNISSGRAVELVYGVVALAAGSNGSETASLPLSQLLPPPALHFHYDALSLFINTPEPWGRSELVAALAVRLAASNDSTTVIDAAVDVTAFTSGTATWTPPSAGAWQLMAFYQRHSNERSCVTAPDATTWLGNGSWMVDHFSAAGAQLMTNFWDEHLLDADTRSLLLQVGEYTWEDSLEMVSALWWTPDLLARFQQARGYSAVLCLPVLFQAANTWNSFQAPYNTTYLFDDSSSIGIDAEACVQDYRLTLNEGYQAFLQHYRSWARSLGLNHSCQPAYNLPLDLAADVAVVDVPELESFDFAESTENYLYFTGPAHIVGHNIVSTEIGAQATGAYAQTLPGLLRLIRGSFAAGVNTLVIHGFPYSGTYPGTTWPGYTTFEYAFTEMWGPRQPVWRHINDTLLFAARSAVVLQAGRPRVDLAVFRWAVPWNPGQLHSGPAAELNAAGFTHDYVGTDSLVSLASLTPDDSPYNAVLLYRQQLISPAASAALLAIAAAGVPVLAIGTVPDTTIGVDGQAAVSTNMEALFDGRYPHASVILDSSDDNLAVHLLAAGIEPRVQVLSVVSATTANASQLFSHWRTDSVRCQEYVYLYNSGPAATFTLSFSVAAKMSPYVLDAWTGEQSPLLVYAADSSGHITANVTLEEEQSAMLAFVGAETGHEKEGLLHVLGHSSNVDHVHLDGNGRLSVLVRPDVIDATLQLSNGSLIHIGTKTATASSSPADVTLGPWSLIVESYSGPAVLSNDSVAANRSVITVATPLQTLVPWTRIPALEQVSGVGVYTTTVCLDYRDYDEDDGSRPSSFTLLLTGPIANTVRVFVNGHLVPALDPAGGGSNERDISALLADGGGGGDNEVRIEAASTLFNAVKARVDDVKNSGLGPILPAVYTDAPWAEFGLMGDVVIRRWKHVTAW